jgi:RNA-dependent RNA polymerase
MLAKNVHSWGGVPQITSDVLGLVAINWLIIADQSSDGIVDPDCLLLAQLHSDSVDYAKSGTPVAQQAIPKLKFRAKPDWNAPETLTKDNARYYESQRAIGKWVPLGICLVSINSPCC